MAENGDHKALRELAAELADGLRDDMRALREDVAGIGIKLAVLEAAQMRIENDVKAAHNERSNIAKELGAYGIALTSFTSKMDNVERELRRLEPTVQNLQNDRTMVVGAAKAANLAVTGGSSIVRALWVVAALIGSCAVLLAAIWQNGPRPH